MIFYVRMLSGVQMGPFDMPGSTYFRDVKWAIERECGLSVGEQRLIYSGRQMEDQRSLDDYNIKENEIIFLVSRLQGH